LTAIDESYRRTREGDRSAFSSWVRRCEQPLRKSLRPFARAVDTEAIVQETLLRMWRLAPRLALEGENASLRYASRLARNLALSEVRRQRRVSTVEQAELERLPAGAVDPDPPADDRLRRTVRDCMEKLPPRPREVLRLRLSGRPDRDLARSLAMKLNTFLQNVVRARRLLADCLERSGIRLEEYL